jgi:phosphoribosyl 1,2-cyclic phosphodiesterase
MVRFTVLASGSKGNSSVVSGGKTRILVDAGLSCRELFRRMAEVGEDPQTLDAIVITHEHSDHVAGLSVTARKLGIPVYFTEATHRAWAQWISPRRTMTYTQWMEKLRAERAAAAEAEAESDATVAVAESDENQADFEADAAEAEPAKADCVAEKAEPAPKKDPARLPQLELFAAGEPFSIGDIRLSPFTTSHDAADPVGFVFETEGVRLGYATDLGYVAPNVREQLKELDLLLLESNHDLEMLRDGPYPWSVKQRVLSRVGHLSNDATAEFLSAEYDGHATYVILAHLSESNNLPELARIAAARALAERGGTDGCQLLLAEQQRPISPISF